MHGLLKLILATSAICLICGCQATLQPREPLRLEDVLARTQAPAAPHDLPRELSLIAAKRIALANSPDLDAAQARIEQAIARLEQARSSYYPNLDIGSSAIYSRHTPENQLGGRTSDQSWIYGAAATVQWTLFNGLSREFNELAAVYAQDASQHMHEDVQRQLANGVAAAFLATLSQKRLMEAARDDADFYQSLLDEVRKRMDAQKAARTDELNFLIAVNNAETAFLNARQYYRLARIGLAELLGLQDVVLPDHLTLIEPELPDRIVDDDRSLIAAALKRPDLQAALAQLQATEAVARARAGERWPSLSLRGSYGVSRTDNARFASDDRTADVGAFLSWDLDLGGRKRGAYREALAARREIEARFEGAYRRVVAEVRSRQTELLMAREQLELQEKTFALAREQRDLVRQSWTAGRDSVTRLNEAQNALTRAQASLATSRIRVLAALENLHATTHSNLP